MLNQPASSPPVCGPSAMDPSLRASCSSSPCCCCRLAGTSLAPAAAATAAGGSAANPGWSNGDTGRLGCSTANTGAAAAAALASAAGAVAFACGGTRCARCFKPRCAATAADADTPMLPVTERQRRANVRLACFRRRCRSRVRCSCTSQKTPMLLMPMPARMQ